MEECRASAVFPHDPESKIDEVCLEEGLVLFLGREEICCSAGEVTDLVPIPYIITEERNYSGRERLPLSVRRT